MSTSTARGRAIPDKPEDGWTKKGLQDLMLVSAYLPSLVKAVITRDFPDLFELKDSERGMGGKLVYLKNTKYKFSILNWQFLYSRYIGLEWVVDKVSYSEVFEDPKVPQHIKDELIYNINIFR